MSLFTSFELCRVDDSVGCDDDRASLEMTSTGSVIPCSALHANKRALHRWTKYRSSVLCKFLKRRCVCRERPPRLSSFALTSALEATRRRANAKARSRRRLAQADKTLKRKCGLQPLNVQTETGMQRLFSKAQAGSGRCTNCCACKQRQRVLSSDGSQAHSPKYHTHTAL